jgi:hypothetical protein
MRCLLPSSGFGDFACFDTTGTDLHANCSPLRALDANGLQVRIKATARAIIRMRNIITELGRLAADFATFSHYFLYLRSRKIARAILMVDNS